MAISSGNKILASDVTAHINDKNNPHGITAESIGAATTAEVQELKTSVSEGKALIAAAVTDKGVNTAADATFATMANNISLLSNPFEAEYVLLVPFTAYLNNRLGTIPTAANKTMSGSVTLITNFTSSISMPPSVSMGTNILKPINIILNGDYKFMVASDQATVIYSSSNSSTSANNTYIEGAALREFEQGQIAWGTLGDSVPGYGKYGIVDTEDQAQVIMDVDITYNTQYQVYAKIESSTITITDNTLNYNFSFKLWASNQSCPYKNFNFAVALPCKLL